MFILFVFSALNLFLVTLNFGGTIQGTAVVLASISVPEFEH